MAIRLGQNQYGKAETRVVRVYRDTARHEIRDLSVSTALRGRFEAAHIRGDQSDVLPTDSQKNTVFAFAKKHGVGAIEEFALALARHFVESGPAVEGARVDIEEYPWQRIPAEGRPHDHAFVRVGGGVRTASVDVDDTGPSVVSGVKDLVVLKSTGSAFRGFRHDEYTTLAETDDRILATSLVARWRHRDTDVDWDASFCDVKAEMLARFAELHSLALQQSLYDMGRAVLEAQPGLVEISFSAPNKHHFLVDLAPFGLDNPGEVFHAADRPYGLIEASVVRD
jgi:urate oxidase